MPWTRNGGRSSYSTPRNYQPPPRPGFFRRLWRWFLWLCTGFGLLLTASLAVVGMLAWIYSPGPPEVAADTVLFLDLTQSIDEKPRVGLLPRPRGPTQTEIVMALDRAKDDPRIVGVVAEIGAGTYSIAQAQEIGAALSAFRAAGKPTYAFAEDLGSFWNGTVDYLLAAQFETLWLQPTGGVGLNGFAIEAPFLKDAFEKAGVLVELEQRHEYKNAADTFDEASMPDPMRESYSALLDSWTDQIAEGLAPRGIEAAGFVSAVFDGGPYLAEEALERGFVDRLAYRDEYEDALEARFGEEFETIGAGGYMAAVGAEDAFDGDAPVIALIYGIGAIEGADQDGFDDRGFDAYGVAEALDAALADDDIAAVVFRVDSPGGAYGPSDMIWREVRRLREAGKPVVAVMGSVAGSGGYYVSMAADHILAQPGTITGSIGVFAGKPALEELWGKLGVNWDRVEIGRHAGIWSSVTPFSPSQRARFRDWMDAAYEDFTGKAAAERGYDPAGIDAVARGRIWSGTDALENGLIDGHGGMLEALAKAKELAGLDSEERYPLRLLPAPPSRWEQIQRAIGGGLQTWVADDPADTMARAAEKTVRALIGIEATGLLAMPPMRVVR